MTTSACHRGQLSCGNNDLLILLHGSPAFPWSKSSQGILNQPSERHRHHHPIGISASAFHCIGNGVGTLRQISTHVGKLRLEFPLLFSCFSFPILQSATQRERVGFGGFFFRPRETTTSIRRTTTASSVSGLFLPPLYHGMAGPGAGILDAFTNRAGALDVTGGLRPLPSFRYSGPISLYFPFFFPFLLVPSGLKIRRGMQQCTKLGTVRDRYSPGFTIPSNFSILRPSFPIIL